MSTLDVHLVGEGDPNAGDCSMQHDLRHATQPMALLQSSDIRRFHSAGDFAQQVLQHPVGTADVPAGVRHPVDTACVGAGVVR